MLTYILIAVIVILLIIVVILGAGLGMSAKILGGFIDAFTKR
jgi:hypothetical protein